MRGMEKAVFRAGLELGCGVVGGALPANKGYSKMMDFETWKNLILDMATQISDREYQASSWFGKGEFVSSPDELYNGLFYDGMIEEFLETHTKDLTEEQSKAGRELVRQMNQYSPASIEHLDPAKVIDDPRWDEVRRSALSFVSALKAEGS